MEERERVGKASWLSQQHLKPLISSAETSLREREREVETEGAREILREKEVEGERRIDSVFM